MNRFVVVLVCFVFTALSLSFSQNNRNIAAEKFSQLKEELPTPNAYRVASGAPGHKYWQQKADYVIRNDSSISDIAVQVKKLLNKIKTHNET